MKPIAEQLGQLTRLEELAGQNSPIHRLHPGAKLAATGVYLLCVLSLGRLQFGRLAPYLLYPVVVLSLAEVPLGLVLRRAALALPFCAFAGLSNLLLERQVLLWLGPVPVTVGLASCGVLLLRALLCVSAVLALAAVTPFGQLTGQLRRMVMPSFCVALLEMLYRYLGLLAGQAGSMLTAYRLRGGSGKGLPVGHMGSFIGQLLLRSTARAQRVYQAMECRGGFTGGSAAQKRPFTRNDWLYLAAVCLPCLAARAVDLPLLLWRLFVC